MDVFKQIRLEIDNGTTPLTFPLAKLAGYLEDLAALIGHQEDAHLMAIEESSTMPCIWIPEKIDARVQQRIRQAKSQTGPADANRAFRSLNRRLEEDNGVGAILDSERAKVIEFPGKNRQKLEVIGPFKEPAEVIGEIERVGGKDESVPVWIRRADGVVFCCETTRRIAKELGMRLYEPIYARGLATRFRDDEGVWELKKFVIEAWDPLANDDLLTVVNRLRSIEGDWTEVADLGAELQHLRSGEDRPI